MQITFRIEKNINSKLEKDIKSLLQCAMFLPTVKKIETVYQYFTNIDNVERMLILAILPTNYISDEFNMLLVELMAIETAIDRVISHYVSANEEFRNKGIGKQMIQFLQNHFAKK
ncbi:hypothetical protein [Fluviispira vulneris]|uniref:hypothetical protein n=1 Tax=Fluviispira vulneris TaxID=2763012 RepID=UPI0016445714|nr:hypothetical protein [Fluviispira vulneris]